MLAKVMFTLLVAFSIVTSPASGANPRWSSKGQPGAVVTAPVMSRSDPSRLYVAAYADGVWRSIDAGESWQAVNVGLEGSRIVSLTIDPIVPTTLYAAASGRMFSTTNGGESWTPMWTCCTQDIKMIVAAAEPRTIYALVNGSIFRTANAGASWSESWNRTDGNVEAFSTVESSPAKLFAVTSAGLFVTTDRGETWRRVPIPGVEHAGAVAVSDDGRTIYANSGDFHTSTDGGATWNTVVVNGLRTSTGMVVDRSSSSTAWATTYEPGGRTPTLHRTTDSGRTWRALEISEEIRALLPAGDTVYAATWSGLYKSIDAAESWVPLHSGLALRSVSDIAIDASDPNLMYVATSGGVFKATNAASEWVWSDDLRDASAVVIDPTNPSVVFASSSAIARKTTDGGASWTEIRPNPAKLAGARALTIDPSHPSTVYAVLVGDGLSKSVDGGSTFSLINSGLPFDFYYGFDTTALAIAPSHPSTVYATTVGVSVSRNGGESWATVSPGLPVYSARALAVDPADSNVVYAASYWQYGLYRSTDGGYAWERLQNGLASETITDVIVDPSDGRNVYVATGDDGVYKSTDRGLTWNALNEGLPDAVNALAIDSSGTFLAAATAAGVFVLSSGDGITLPPLIHPERLGSDPSRLPRLLQQLRGLSSGSPPASRDDESSHAGLVFAVAGNVAGVAGSYFRSDVTLMNGSSSSQDVIAVWLAAGSDGTDAPAVRLRLPSSAITVADFIGKMGVSGIGSLLVIGIDSEMNVDADADLTGFSRIWTAGPGGRGTVSQSFSGADIASIGRTSAASAIGLRMDDDFRTNVGIVNLDAAPHTFLLTFTGDRRQATLSVDVDPFSMKQVPVPEGNYGALVARFSVTGGDFPWTAYGASVDNLTGDGWTSQAVRARGADAGQPPSGSAHITGAVLNQAGECLPGAVVELVDGWRAGEKLIQKECGDPWYDGWSGFNFSGLAAGPVRVRASMPGYRTKVETFTAVISGHFEWSLFHLERE